MNYVEPIGLFFEQNKDKLTRIALSDEPVLLTGETGVDKTNFAHFIHNASLRKQQKFCAVNLSAINPSLFESELFGHAKGTFTGATVARDGLFKTYEGGTVFFDEFGEISLANQIKLLQVIDNQEILPVGSDTPIKIDVRIITATHQHLPTLIKAGKFRHDFYHRCCVFSFDILPLRERKEEITIFVNYFIDKFTQELSRKNIPFECPDELSINKFVKDLSKEKLYGNIRELKNRVKQFVIFYAKKPSKHELKVLLEETLINK